MWFLGIIIISAICKIFDYTDVLPYRSVNHKLQWVSGML